MSEGITFNAKNIKAQHLVELLSAARRMLTEVTWRRTFVADDLMAEIDRMRNSLAREMNPRGWERYPGVWFTAKVTTTEVDAQEIIFVVLDEDLSAAAANSSFSMMETMEQPEENPFHVSIVSLN